MAEPDEAGKLGQGAIEGIERPLIKPGLYDLSFKFYETARLFGGKSIKLVLHFEIVSYGDHFGTVLQRFYNVTRLKGKPGKSGDFVVGRHSNFVIEYVTLFGMPRRLDRIPMTAFKDRIIQGKVKTVTHGYGQAKLPKPLHYSVISDLVGVKEL